MISRYAILEEIVHYSLPYIAKNLVRFATFTAISVTAWNSPTTAVERQKEPDFSGIVSTVFKCSLNVDSTEQSALCAQSEMKCILESKFQG